MQELYHYNGETGEFVGTSSARPDPMEEGRYLVPANATIIPAAPQKGKVSVFLNGAWSNVDDNRGDVYWLPDGTKVKVDTLDHVKPSDALVVEPQASIEDERNNSTLTRAAFAIGAANAGWITETEAEEWGAGVAIPSIAANAIAALPEADRFAMRVSVRTRQKIWRTDTLVLILMAAQDPKVTAEQMDTFFGIGA